MTNPKEESVKELLRSSFTQLAQNLGGDNTTTQKWTEALIARYTEPQRRYHTIHHIHSMLTSLKQLRPPMQNEQVIKLAIFFHDWIYDPQAADNELRSIAHFQTFADALHLPPKTAATVASYIESTIQHAPSPEHDDPDADLALFLDLDLEVLSRSEAAYALYAEQIRAEYGHLSDEEYCAGRMRVLSSFLLRGGVYFSDAFGWLEDRARGNMEEEMGRLRMALGRRGAGA